MGDNKKWVELDPLCDPRETLAVIAINQGVSIDDIAFARHMDNIDPLKSLRQEFFYPKIKNLVSADLTLVDGDQDCVYFNGNSLGLLPRGVKKYIDAELDKWAKTGSYGHFAGDMPWISSDECVEKDMAKLVGACDNEIAVMNGLTVNMHLALISFYRPTTTRYKIVLESNAFPSDHYVAKSQIDFHGLDPKECLLEISPRKGEETLRHSDILDLIEQHGSSIAVIMLSGVQYYTGQLFDMEAITKAGHKQGCYVGFDLAHAVGNVEIHLHDWGVDFACWCSYKYLNAGAGGMAGFFLHDRHSNNNFPKLVGWWGHNVDTRFIMDNDLSLSHGAHAYRLSNPAMLLCCSLRASLDIFNKTSLPALRTKSRLLTAYLERLITDKFSVGPKVTISIITPSDPIQRGAQLSLKFSVASRDIYAELVKRGVVCDEREPDVIRIAPVPLYCSFTDVQRFITYLVQAVDAARIGQ